MKLQALIDRFNKPDVHLVVSSWPERPTGKKSYHGDAAFTRETLLTLVKQHDMKFVVLCERGEDNRPQVIANGHILILRVFDHKKLQLYPMILQELAKFPHIRHVTVHSNFTFSGIRHFALLVPFLGLIKLTGRRVTHVAHNVLDSIDFIASQLNIVNTTLIDLLNVGVKFYNWCLGKIADDVVVLDIQGKHILDKYVEPRKVLYNPHWVKPRTTKWTKTAAKRALGIPSDTRVIVSFGFISTYKGSDLLARMFAGTKASNTMLIFAGGKAPSMEHEPHYQTYYQQFESLTQADTRMRVSGFIPDDKLGLYFAAADLVVLPYRGLMGGSGALAHAIGYDKPFLVSTPMKALWGNADMKQALTNVGKTQEELMFSLNAEGMKKIVKTVHSPKTLRTLKRLSSQIKETRNIVAVTGDLYNRLYKDDGIIMPRLGYAPALSS